MESKVRVKIIFQDKTSARNKIPYCLEMITSKSSSFSLASAYTKQNPKEIITPTMYIKMTKNCEGFTKRRGYWKSYDTLTDKEKHFPVAFGIVMYTDVELFERLLRAIYRPHNYYCIHVDSKSNSNIKHAVAGIAACFDNVILSSKSYAVKWGTISVLNAELICMGDLWKYKKWKYFINLTGQEFPLRTNSELVQILESLNGYNDAAGRTPVP